MRSKDRADVLRRRRDDVHVAQRGSGVDELELEPQLSREIELGHLVDPVDRRRGLERLERRAGRGRELLGPRRRVVTEAVVVLGTADVGRERRRQAGERVDPRVRDLIDGRDGARGIGHAPEPSARPRSSRLRDRSGHPEAQRAARRLPCGCARFPPPRPLRPERPRHELVMDLQEHARTQSSACELVVDAEERDLHDVGRAALDRRVERRALRVLSRSTRFGLVRSGNGRRRPKIVSV